MADYSCLRCGWELLSDEWEFCTDCQRILSLQQTIRELAGACDA